MQAIILVGGFGTRLKSVIPDLPKPLAPIHNKPFLAYLLRHLKEQGITRVIFSVHYLREKIEDYFKSSYEGLKIDYAIEEEPLGTGGAIVNALPSVDPSQPIFVLNGDTLLKLNYASMLKAHLEANPSMTIALKTIQDGSRYGLVTVENQRLVSFQEKGSAAAGLINTGVYLIQPDVFKGFSLPKAFSFEKDFMHNHLKKINPLAFVVNDYFIDIGVPEDYQRAQIDFN